MGWKMAQMAENTIFSSSRENDQKKMKKNSLVDKIFMRGHGGRTTMVIHDKKNEEWGEGVSIGVENGPNG